MRWQKYGVLAIVLLLVCIGSVSALEPDRILITVNPEWVVANGIDQSIVNITVFNGTEGVPGIQVNLSVEDSLLGSILPGVFLTDSNGTTQATFKANITSGDTNITGQVTYGAGSSLENKTPIHLDHGSPYKKELYFETEPTVGSTTEIVVHLMDINNNSIDNRNPFKTDHENIRFLILGSPDNLAIFYINETYNTTAVILPVDENGNVSVLMNVSTVPGNNRVFIDPLSSASFETITLHGVATEPFSIDLWVNPTVKYQPVDDDPDSLKYFTLRYVLKDIYGNRLNAQEILINATDPFSSQEYHINTTTNGEAVFKYGPSSIVKTVLVTATSLKNPNATVPIQLEFYDNSPVNLDLSVIPSTIPSRDVGSNASTFVYAKVTDIKGAPVSGQTVQFELIHPSNYPLNQIELPTYDDVTFMPMNSTSDITDDNGIASAHLIPGSFISNKTDPLYNETSTANVTVKALWSGLEESAQVTYRNFPYLSVFTSVSNETVSEGDIVNVTIQVRGEGLEVRWREPVDVVLATPRGWSMLVEDEDRMVYAYKGENILVDKLLAAKPISPDSVEILTYGPNPNGTVDISTIGDYSKYIGKDKDDSDNANYTLKNYIGNGIVEDYYYVWHEQNFTSDLNLIKAKINLTTPWDVVKGDDFNPVKPTNPLRLEIYNGITDLSSLTGAGHQNKILVLLVDNAFNYWGDPLARGKPTFNPKIIEGNRYFPFPGPDNGWSDDDPLQNMSNFAIANNVKIYSIYVQDTENTNDRETLKTLAESTGGYYRYAQNASQLESIYAEIADKIIKDAGLNTELVIDMGVIEVNGNPWNQSVSEFLQYLYIPNQSTHVRSFFKDGPELYNYTVNQTDDYYNNDYKLQFSVGNITVGQIWEATYSLKVNGTGTIDLFGYNSSINFTNPFGDTFSDLGNLLISSVPLQNLKTPTNELEITNFQCLDSSCADCWQKKCTVEDAINLKYGVYYDGTKTVKEKFYIMKKSTGGEWRQFATATGSGGIIRLSTWNLPAGDYKFRMWAYVDDETDPLAPGRHREDVEVTVVKKPFFIKLT